MSDSTANRSAELTLAAVDLGATSGRVILGGVTEGVLRMKHIARFPNVPQLLGESLHWNIQSLFAGLSDGLREAISASPGLTSIGIDSWAVDYGLLRDGRLLGIPHHYRDGRNLRGVEVVHDLIGPTALFAHNGLQHLDFNTVFQFAVEAEAGFLELADRALLIPDLIAYWLTGQMRTELTNASTTGLLSVTEGTWDVDLMSRLGLPSDLLPDLVSPGEHIGDLSEPVTERLGACAPIQVTAVGSHDTASAVVAVPMEGPNCAFISSGTWSLVGLEIDAPVVTEEARLANFTNEGGVDGTIRFLKNVSGLWLLSESMRQWEQDATDAQRSSDLETLLAEAAEVEDPVAVFDPSDDRFTPPGDMPTRIREWCIEHGQGPPHTRAEVVRSILESLAAAYASTIATAEDLTGTTVETIHIVGGGSQNALLCRLTAERTECRVIAGPVEATAIGNLLVQARAVGQVDPTAGLGELRRIVKNSFPVVEYSSS
ncbi:MULTISPECIES: rhamnulokinase [unclassified Brevibacterium]|uniref:rhamnulokinase n=1 Tax=unclassified Brevibacterium TaxID=2614124 RepID=UPI001092D47C|nr:rhamnulokinase family protein [Brevibacterium sp. S22]TGD29659.1 rhamnulokinase [Brevibacterium sp. S22]